MPKFSHILFVRAGQDEPAKIRVLRIVSTSGCEEERCRRMGFK